MSTVFVLFIKCIVDEKDVRVRVDMYTVMAVEPNLVVGVVNTMVGVASRGGARALVESNGESIRLRFSRAIPPLLQGKARKTRKFAAVKRLISLKDARM